VQGVGLAGRDAEADGPEAERLVCVDDAVDVLAALVGRGRWRTRGTGGAGRQLRSRRLFADDPRSRARAGDAPRRDGARRARGAAADAPGAGAAGGALGLGGRAHGLSSPIAAAARRRESRESPRAVAPAGTAW